MNWKAIVVTAQLGVWLCPSTLRADGETETAPKAPEEKPADIAPPPAGKGLLGDTRIGASAAIGVPHPLTGGIDIVYADLIALSVSGGRFNTTVSDTDIEIRNLDVALRWFPFRGSFFVGAAYGNQGVVGKRTVDLTIDASGVPMTIPTTVRLEIESSYLTPQLGWFARWDSGFTLGFDIGLQMPSGAKSELQTSFTNVSAASEAAVLASEDYQSNKKDVEDAAEAIGKQALPQITLLRMGWLF